MIIAYAEHRVNKKPYTGQLRNVPKTYEIKQIFHNGIKDDKFWKEVTPLVLDRLRRQCDNSGY